MNCNVKFIEGLNRFIRLIDREIMRSKGRLRRFNPYAASAGRLLRAPAVPQTWDWSKNDSLDFPIDGNNKYGDCYMADIAHHSQAMTGCVGQEDSFDLNALIRDYLALSGGDNGLGPDVVYPYWKKGIIGTNHVIYDAMQVNTADPVAMSAAGFYFGGLDFLLGIPDRWLQDIHPGVIWDSGPGVSPDDNNGHATYISSRVDSHTFKVETWGLNPPVFITDGGVGVCDSEAFVVFSPDWFNADGYAPNGMHYNDLASLWQQMGGRALPPWNGVPPKPPAPPPSPFPPSPLPPPPIPVSEIDDLFAMVEAALHNRPKLLLMVVELQKAVDMLLGHGPQKEGVSINPAVIKAIADSVIPLLERVFINNPKIEAALKAIQGVIDALALVTT